MGKFSRASQKSDQYQATQVAKLLQGTHGHRKCPADMSVETHESRLIHAAKFMRSTHNQALREMTVAQATGYLEIRSEEANKHKTFNTDKSAIHAMLRAQGKLSKNGQIPVRFSKDDIAMSRSYRHVHIDMIRDRMTPRNALSVDIIHEAGLRVHELLTLERIELQPADIRKIHKQKFEGKSDWVRYSVKGKGSLIREVRLQHATAERLELTRLTTPVIVKDRAVFYTQKYDIGGGKKFSNAFRSASKRVLGFSNGAHGMRHTYAKTELGRYQDRGISFVDSKTIVSQELGHFRPDIVDAYLC